jgi:hypothetical protein
MSRIQAHDYGNELSSDCERPCTYCRVPWTKRDELTCVFRDAPESAGLRPNPSPVYGYPNLDLDRLRIIREEGQQALNTPSLEE